MFSDHVKRSYTNELNIKKLFSNITKTSLSSRWHDSLIQYTLQCNISSGNNILYALNAYIKQNQNATAEQLLNTVVGTICDPESASQLYFPLSKKAEKIIASAQLPPTASPAAVCLTLISHTDSDIRLCPHEASKLYAYIAKDVGLAFSQTYLDVLELITPILGHAIAMHIAHSYISVHCNSIDPKHHKPWNAFVSEWTNHGNGSADKRPFLEFLDMDSIHISQLIARATDNTDQPLHITVLSEHADSTTVASDCGSYNHYITPQEGAYKRLQSAYKNSNKTVKQCLNKQTSTDSPKLQVVIDEMVKCLEIALKGFSPKSFKDSGSSIANTYPMLMQVIHTTLSTLKEVYITEALRIVSEHQITASIHSFTECTLNHNTIMDRINSHITYSPVLLEHVRNSSPVNNRYTIPSQEALLPLSKYLYLTLTSTAGTSEKHQLQYLSFTDRNDGEGVICLQFMQKMFVLFAQHNDHFILEKNRNNKHALPKTVLIPHTKETARVYPYSGDDPINSREREGTAFIAFIIQTAAPDQPENPFLTQFTKLATQTLTISDPTIQYTAKQSPQLIAQYFATEARNDALKKNMTVLKWINQSVLDDDKGKYLFDKLVKHPGFSLAPPSVHEADKTIVLLMDEGLHFYTHTTIPNPSSAPTSLISHCPKRSRAQLCMDLRGSTVGLFYYSMCNMNNAVVRPHLAQQLLTMKRYQNFGQDGAKARMFPRTSLHMKPMLNMRVSGTEVSIAQDPNTDTVSNQTTLFTNVTQRLGSVNVSVSHNLDIHAATQLCISSDISDALTLSVDCNIVKTVMASTTLTMVQHTKDSLVRLYDKKESTTQCVNGAPECKRQVIEKYIATYIDIISFSMESTFPALTKTVKLIVETILDKLEIKHLIQAVQSADLLFDPLGDLYGFTEPKLDPDNTKAHITTNPDNASNENFDAQSLDLEEEREGSNDDETQDKTDTDSILRATSELQGLIKNMNKTDTSMSGFDMKAILISVATTIGKGGVRFIVKHLIVVIEAMVRSAVSEFCKECAEDALIVDKTIAHITTVNPVWNFDTDPNLEQTIFCATFNAMLERMRVMMPYHIAKHIRNPHIGVADVGIIMSTKIKAAASLIEAIMKIVDKNDSDTQIKPSRIVTKPGESDVSISTVLQAEDSTKYAASEQLETLHYKHLASNTSKALDDIFGFNDAFLPDTNSPNHPQSDKELYLHSDLPKIRGVFSQREFDRLSNNDASLYLTLNARGKAAFPQYYDVLTRPFITSFIFSATPTIVHTFNMLSKRGLGREITLGKVVESIMLKPMQVQTLHEQTSAKMPNASSDERAARLLAQHCSTNMTNELEKTMRGNDTTINCAIFPGAPSKFILRKSNIHTLQGLENIVDNFLQSKETDRSTIIFTTLISSISELINSHIDRIETEADERAILPTHWQYAQTQPAANQPAAVKTVRTFFTGIGEKIQRVGNVVKTKVGNVMNGNVPLYCIFSDGIQVTTILPTQLRAANILYLLQNNKLSGGPATTLDISNDHALAAKIHAAFNKTHSKFIEEVYKNKDLFKDNELLFQQALGDFPKEVALRTLKLERLSTAAHSYLHLVRTLDELGPNAATIKANSNLCAAMQAIESTLRSKVLVGMTNFFGRNARIMNTHNVVHTFSYSDSSDPIKIVYESIPILICKTIIRTSHCHGNQLPNRMQVSDTLFSALAAALQNGLVDSGILPADEMGNGILHTLIVAHNYTAVDSLVTVNTALHQNTRYLNQTNGAGVNPLQLLILTKKLAYAPLRIENERCTSQLKKAFIHTLEKKDPGVDTEGPMLTWYQQSLIEKLALNEYVDINSVVTVGTHKYTALHLACMKRDTATVVQILQSPQLDITNPVYDNLVEMLGLTSIVVLKIITPILQPVAGYNTTKSRDELLNTLAFTPHPDNTEYNKQIVSYLKQEILKRFPALKSGMPSKLAYHHILVPGADMQVKGTEVVKVQTTGLDTSEALTLQLFEDALQFPQLTRVQQTVICTHLINSEGDVLEDKIKMILESGITEIASWKEFNNLVLLQNKKTTDDSTVEVTRVTYSDINHSFHTMVDILFSSSHPDKLKRPHCEMLLFALQEGVAKDAHFATDFKSGSLRTIWSKVEQQLQTGSGEVSMQQFLQTIMQNTNVSGAPLITKLRSTLSDIFQYNCTVRMLTTAFFLNGNMSAHNPSKVAIHEYTQTETDTQMIPLKPKTVYKSLLETILTTGASNLLLAPVVYDSKGSVLSSALSHCATLHSYSAVITDAVNGVNLRTTTLNTTNTNTNHEQVKHRASLVHKHAAHYITNNIDTSDNAKTGPTALLSRMTSVAKTLSDKYSIMINLCTVTLMKLACTQCEQVSIPSDLLFQSCALLLQHKSRELQPLQGIMKTLSAISPHYLAQSVGANCHSALELDYASYLARRTMYYKAEKPLSYASKSEYKDVFLCGINDALRTHIAPTLTNVVTQMMKIAIAANDLPSFKAMFALLVKNEDFTAQSYMELEKYISQLEASPETGTQVVSEFIVKAHLPLVQFTNDDLNILLEQNKEHCMQHSVKSMRDIIWPHKGRDEMLQSSDALPTTTPNTQLEYVATQSPTAMRKCLYSLQ